eukprot:scaffold6250_cov151-Isochrysis_galbana.AAC.2
MIGANPSVCDVLEVEVVIPRVVRCNLFSHAAMHGWGLGFCRAEKHAVSVLTVIWSRGVLFASSAYSSGRGKLSRRGPLFVTFPPPSGGGGVDIIGGKL